MKNHVVNKHTLPCRRLNSGSEKGECRVSHVANIAKKKKKKKNNQIMYDGQTGNDLPSCKLDV